MGFRFNAGENCGGAALFPAVRRRFRRSPADEAGQDLAGLLVPDGELGVGGGKVAGVVEAQEGRALKRAGADVEGEADQGVELVLAGLSGQGGGYLLGKLVQVGGEEADFPRMRPLFEAINCCSSSMSRRVMKLRSASVS